jgi:NADH-quinone oxidoreductase subunit N
MYRADAFAAFAKVLIYIASAVAIIIAPRFFQRTSGDDLKPEYPVLILLSACGMGMMVSASDLLLLYVGLELAALPSYVLAAFHRQDDRSAEAGLKYFVLGALASGILLYGVTLIYGFSGSTQLDVIAGVVSGQTERSIGLLFGIVFILSGLAFKVSAVPFHMWTPDVYEGAPTPVAAFFSAAPKAAALGLLARVMIVAFPGNIAADWQQILIFIAIASMVLGAVAAIAQTNFKRLLAYSSIANIGYALLGIAAGTTAGVQAMLVFMTLYVIDQFGFFAILLSLSRVGKPIRRIADLAGLRKDKPVTAIALTVLSLSVLGMPPLAGFWAKFYVFGAAAEAGYWMVGAAGLVASVVAGFYYLRIIKLMWFDPTPEGVGPMDASPIEARTIAWASAAFSFPLVIVAIGWIDHFAGIAATGFGAG